MLTTSLTEEERYWEGAARRKLAILAGVERGEINNIDGVMSPTSKAIAERLGTTEFDMNAWWVEAPQDWICPACGRSKLDIARVNTKGEAMCWLVEHHDHMKDVLKRQFQQLSVQQDVVVADQDAEEFAKRSASMISAYENTLICVDCNNADTDAKKAAKAPSAFSFSPKELRRIGVPKPNEKVGIDKNVARAIWAEQAATFEVRMKIANRIAEIAAKNEHWFQVGEWAARADVIHARASAYVASKGAWGLVEDLKGPRKKTAARPLDDWRKKPHKPPRPGPTPTEIDHAGQVGSPKRWHAVDSLWRCPGCGRDKRSIVRRNTKNEWAFTTERRYFHDATARWKHTEHFTCMDCAKVAEDLGKEAAGRVGQRVSGYSSLVELSEVARCIVVQPHTRHNINNTVVEAMLDRIEARVMERVRANTERVADDK